MSAREEKRRTPRLQPFVVPCRYVVDDRREDAFITDISERGARIQTDVEPPATGAVVNVEARLGRQAAALRMPGTVRWSRPSARGGFVFGMRFEGATPDAQRALDGVIEEFKRRAASIG
jgi:hypothetical protein